MTLNVSNAKYLDSPQVSKVDKAPSPPLTPMSQRVSSIPDMASHSSEIQGKKLVIVVVLIVVNFYKFGYVFLSSYNNN